MPHTRASLKSKRSTSIITDSDMNQSTSGTLTDNGPIKSQQHSSDTAPPHKLLFGKLNTNYLEGSLSHHNFDNSFLSESTTDKMTSAEGSVGFPDQNNQERERPDESANNATASMENLVTSNIQQPVEQYHLEASNQKIQFEKGIIDEIQIEAEDSEVEQCGTGTAEVSGACNEGGNQENAIIIEDKPVKEIVGHRPKRHQRTTAKAVRERIAAATFVTTSQTYLVQLEDECTLTKEEERVLKKAKAKSVLMESILSVRQYVERLAELAQQAESND